LAAGAITFANAPVLFMQRERLGAGMISKRDPYTKQVSNGH
jgi:hypothetical protein